MDWLLRRNFWVLKLSGWAIALALGANTTTTLLSLYLLGTPATTPEAEAGDEAGDEGEEVEEGETALALASTAARPDERARRAERTAERILGRNPFCPSCTAPEAAAPPLLAGAPLEPGELDLGSARRSELPLQVAATMEAADPSRSLATLVDPTRGLGGLYGVGDRLGPEIEIVRVTAGVVHISNAGRLEYIPFDGLPPAPKVVAEPKTKAEKPDPAAERSIPGATEAIQCSGQGDCVVERAFVEQLLADPKLLLGQGGASPATTKDGAPGFRLRGVKKGTLPDLLGLKNGDVITEVGGSPLTMDVLPGLYGKLRHASHIEVTVDRRGDRMTRQLEIRS